MVSYLVVIVVGVVTLAVAAESVTPTAFNRHMLGMQQMMMGGQMSMEQMGADLFTNFRAAVTEALLVSTIAALISAILVSVFVSRRVVTPIRQMMTASRHIAAGHYRERVKVVSDDELGQLALSFNQMAAGVGFGFPVGFAAALILFLGHALNIVMGSLSIVVHGVRLNMLEFSGHLGMEWTGIPYTPFRNSDRSVRQGS